jgi:hypothetical protein
MPRGFVHLLVAFVIGGSIELEPPCPWTSRLSELPSQLHSGGIGSPALCRGLFVLEAVALVCTISSFYFSICSKRSTIVSHFPQTTLIC